MRSIPRDIKFLHCMSTPDFLESGLRSGLMLTDHKVSFRPTRNKDELLTLVTRVVPLLDTKLARLGTPFATLRKPRRKVLMMGIGNVQATVPMLCFSEVAPGESTAMAGDGRAVAQFTNGSVPPFLGSPQTTCLKASASIAVTSPTTNCGTSAARPAR